jgi:transposase
VTPAGHEKSKIFLTGERLCVLHVFNGILYVLTTGCTWHDVPANYGTKSTVHRYHLELCEKGVHQAIFLDLLQSGYTIQKIDLSHCATDTKDISAKKGDRPDMMAIKR